jgi:predicted dehydrogenase
MPLSDEPMGGPLGSAPKPLTVAVVGLGYWGPNLLRVLSELDDFRVKWICDLDEHRVRRLRARNPSVTATTHIAEILSDDEVDAVALATPVYSHHGLASRCLRAGKHTFVEKPLAPSAAEADELLALAQSEGRQLMCGHTFLYSPAVRQIKEMISRGELGEIFFVSSSRVNLGLHQRDVSVVWDLGPHDFSILLSWFGERPVSVRAVGRDSIVSGIYDVAFITLKFGSGLVASVELSWLAPSKLRRAVVVGRERMLVYEDSAPEPIRVFNHGVVYKDPETFGEYHLSYRTGDIVSPKLDSYEPLSRELSHFAAAVRGEESLREATILARDVVAVTEAADRSLRADGEEILLSYERQSSSAGMQRRRPFRSPTRQAIPAR